jgi:hypothetical protein
VKLQEIKSLEAIRGAIKKIRRTGIQLKISNPKLKTLIPHRRRVVQT